MSPFTFRPRELLEHLAEADVDFIIVGGLAVGTWGYLRATKDLDIVPDPVKGNLERLAHALVALDGKVIVEDRSLKSSAISVFLLSGDRALVRTSLGAVDVLQGLPQIPRFEELSPRSVKTEIGDIEVSVCSLEDLLAMKRAADRPVDRADIEALLIAHGDD